MMMYAVAEKHPFRVYREITEITALPVTGVVLQDILKHLPYLEVVPAVLVPEYVPAVLRGFPEMIDILFLPECQVIPSRYPVPHNLYVGKLVYQIPEILLVLVPGCVPA